MKIRRVISVLFLFCFTACTGGFEYAEPIVEATPTPEGPANPDIKLGFAELPGEATVESCVGPVYLYSYSDSTKKEIPLSSTEDTEIQIQTSATIYRDGSCGQLGQPSLRAGTTSTIFSFKKDNGGVDFTLSAVAGAKSSQTKTIRLLPSNPKATRVSTASNLGSGECVPAEVHLLDNHGNATITATERELTLVVAGQMTPSTSASCADTNFRVVFPAGGGTVSFYLKGLGGSGSATVRAEGVGLIAGETTVFLRSAYSVVYDREDSISGGGADYCAIVNGAAKCWGDGSYGRLGNGTSLDKSVPTDVSGLDSGVTSVSAGHYMSCAIVNGATKCWGYNTGGQLGDGTNTTSTVPRPVIGMATDSTRVSAGTYHTCAIQGKEAKCWGNGSYGALGNGATADKNVPVVVSGGAGVMDISAQGYYGVSCAIGPQREGLCWGRGGLGALGNGENLTSNLPVNVSLPLSDIWTDPTLPAPSGHAGFSRISVGSHASSENVCSLVKGKPYCWGLNNNGELGNGSFTNANRPTPVFELESATLVGAGGYEGGAFALKDGGLFSWGKNSYGTFLAGTAGTNYNKPLAATFLGATQGITKYFRSGQSGCYLKGSKLYCHGRNTTGELGRGNVTASTAPQEVSGIDGVLGAVSAGPQNTCVAWNGRPYCWGANRSGVVKSAGTAMEPSPVSIDGTTEGTTEIAVGPSHGCLVKNGKAYCWGKNTSGQVGKPSATEFVPASNPEAVGGLDSGVTAVAVGDSHSCAIRNGSVYCWGSNHQGQLGDDTSSSSSSARIVSSLLSSEVTQIAAAGNFTCALGNGKLSCWGKTSRTPQLAPTSTPEVGLSALAVSRSHVCVVQSGLVKCFGANDRGQLGNGTQTESTAYETVPGLTGATSVSVGESHTCAVANGKVSCWGDNTSGQLGNSGAGAFSSTPVSTGLEGAVSVTAGGFHSCATANGDLFCWGANALGQLGNGGKLPLAQASLVSLP